MSLFNTLKAHYRFLKSIDFKKTRIKVTVSNSDPIPTDPGNIVDQYGIHFFKSLAEVKAFDKASVDHAIEAAYDPDNDLVYSKYTPDRYTNHVSDSTIKGYILDTFAREQWWDVVYNDKVLVDGFIAHGLDKNDHRWDLIPLDTNLSNAILRYTNPNGTINFSTGVLSGYFATSIFNRATLHLEDPITVISSLEYYTRRSHPMYILPS